MDSTEILKTDYVSPEILINTKILRDNNGKIISYKRPNDNVSDVNFFLLRDFILFVLYWVCLLIGIFVHWILLIIWLLILFLSVFVHIYFGKSPPFYPLYRGSDAKYIPYFNESSIEYISNWNEKGLINLKVKGSIGGITQRSLTLKLCHIEMFGSLNDSNFGSIEIFPAKVANKSDNNIIDAIKQYGENKLIRLKIKHIIKFSDHQSNTKFLNLLKQQRKSLSDRSKKEFHLEYNFEIDDKLLMNTNYNKWNSCCSNRNASIILYAFGIGFCYRSFQDFCIKTKTYECIKEITL